MDPNSLKNLKPFKPGAEWTGNAGSRPEKLPYSDRYAEISEALIPKNIRRGQGLKNRATWGDAIALGLARQALRSPSAAKELREGSEGKAPQRIILEGNTNVPLQLPSVTVNFPTVEEVAK